jgi:uncharacterized membrane protein YsdA (DUF1294 family)/cold shock CspA family protein
LRRIGTIIDWNDEKGFGFVLYDNKQKRAFVHIKAFNSQKIRPVNGDIISYELSRDSTGRDRATNVGIKRSENTISVKHLVNSKRDIEESGQGYFMKIIIAIFGAYLLFLTRSIPFIIPFYFIFGLITYSMYSGDKDAANNGEWRTSESTLLMFGLIGGWIGAIFAQRKLRHKNRKMDFQFKFLITVILNWIGLVAYTTMLK